jgi:integrase
VSTNLVKSWCQAVGLEGNYGSHTMRKTWGWWQYKRGKPVPLLMEAYGHATQKQTLDYLCIQAEEVAELYDLEL